MDVRGEHAGINDLLPSGIWGLSLSLAGLATTMLSFQAIMLAPAIILMVEYIVEFACVLLLT